MKTIKYKLGKNGGCLDTCPHGLKCIFSGMFEDIHVGSQSCDNCKNNHGHDRINKVVRCHYKKQDEDNN